MWAFLAILVISLAVSLTMKPKVTDPAKPSGLGDINVPTAEVGREIPVLFGTRDMAGPNVVWYGDLRAAEVKK